MRLDIPFTELYEYAPISPTATLDSPVLATVDAATNARLELGVRSRAYLPGRRF
ncbi:MAG: hypothetical protein NZ699_16535 [Roseiflexus sp.]|nr:hypothetical protein [Roseiflexus sp.]MCS7290730.1 hypothetical protein [Roseiflexus sp.]MDW8147439.1 hypothetical protein [Roseiflexaceae bacterium]MDW8233708.1 hypothetical protein [Roseiflexaceae bacterium]